METITFKSTGSVLGSCWGGCNGSYSAKCYTSNESYEDLINQNNEALKNNSLDAGMGFEYLIGALLRIETIRTIEIEGRNYSNSEYSATFIGELTDEQQDFLLDVDNAF